MFDEELIKNCNNLETSFKTTVGKLNYYPDKKTVDAWRSMLLGDHAEKLITAIRKIKASESFADPSYLTGTDALESMTEYIIALSDEKNNAKTGIKTVTIRLYPTYSGIAYVCPQPVTTQLSHSRFIQSKTPAQNIRVTLQNNIALNTLDTQWYGFYTELFSNIIEYGNPAFTLRAGHDRIEKCYLTEPLTFAKRNDDPMQTFTLGIISSSTGINVSDSGSS
jgi:hypothetical protein